MKSLTGQTPKYDRSLALQVIISLALAIAGGFLIEHWYSNYVGVPPVDLDALEEAFAEEIATTERVHKSAVFSKRVEIQRLKDLQASIKEKLAERQGTRKFPVPIEFANYLHVPVLDENFRLAQPICELLGLTETEKEGADDAIWRAWVEISKEEHKRGKVTQEKGVVIVQVDQYSEAGRAIKDRLRKRLSTALGKDASEFLLQCDGQDHYNLKGRIFNFGRGGLLRIVNRGNRWRLSLGGGAPWAIVGRFYEKLPPEIQKKIRRQYRHLPTLEERGLQEVQQ